MDTQQGGERRVQDVLETKEIKAGRRTYYLDLKKTKGGDDKYLVITESRITRDGDKRKSRLFIFPEDIEEFIAAVREMGQKVVR